MKLQTLHRAMFEIAAARDLDEMYRFVAEQAARLVGASSGFVVSRNASTSTSSIVAAWPEREGLVGYELEDDESMVSKVISSDIDLLAVNSYSDSSYCARSVTEYGPVMSVPLRSTAVGSLFGMRIFGGITVSRPPGSDPFDEVDEPVLRAVADIAGLALENARLHRRYAQLEEDVERREKQSRVLLAQSQEELFKKTNEMRAFSAKTTKIIETERARIAQGLHDSVKQDIAGTIHTLEAASSALPDNAEKAKKYVDASLEFLHRADEDVQSIVRNLRPMQLDARGLVASLRDYCAFFQAQTGVGCTFESYGDEVKIPRKSEEAIYYIAVEALQNVSQHSAASDAKVRINYTSKAVRLVVSDNGRGFDGKPVIGSIDNGLGLPGMKRRAQDVGGDVVIESERGGGTTVSAYVPVGD